jgi:hypothetical protein
MATFGIRKSLEDIAYELRGIKNVLSSIWHSKYQLGETNLVNPDLFADEYISTEECARRLGVSDQTIRNWIAYGKKGNGKGWTEGIHYINVCPEMGKKAVIRIPWTQLIHSFSQNKDVSMADFVSSRMYRTNEMQEV